MACDTGGSGDRDARRIAVPMRSGSTDAYGPRFVNPSTASSRFPAAGYSESPSPPREFPPGNPSFWGTTWGTKGPLSPPTPGHRKAGSPLPTGPPANEPGGSRTHDLRIKSPIPAYTQSALRSPKRHGIKPGRSQPRGPPPEVRKSTPPRRMRFSRSTGG